MAPAAPAAPAVPAAVPAAAAAAVPAACGDFLQPVPAPAGAPAQWLAFMNAVNAINDYTLTLHEVDVSQPPEHSEDRILKLKFMRPCYGKVLVQTGRLADAEALWHGGHKLRGHLGGNMTHLKAIIQDTDSRGTDERGLPMYAAYFPWIINKFNATNLSYAPGPAVNGVATDAITATGAEPSKNYGLVKDVLLLSSVTHLPLVNDGYDAAGKDVLHAEFQDLVINPGLTVDDFNKFEISK